MDAPALSTVVPPGRVRGVVALVRDDGLAVAELQLDRKGATVLRAAEARNGDAACRFDPQQPAEVAAALANVLQLHGLPRRLLAVGLPDALFSLALCELPPARGRALAALVRKRVREQVAALEHDLLADVLPLSASEPGGQRHALLAWGEQRTLAAFAAAFEAHGLAVGRVVPPAAALLDLFRLTRDPAATQLELLVRLVGHSVVIAVARGPDLLYARFLGDVLADAPDGMLGALLELQRTVNFLRDTHRKESPGRLWFTGLAGSDADDAASVLELELGIPAAPLRVACAGAPGPFDADTLLGLASLAHHAGDRRRPSLHLLPWRPPRDRLLSGIAALCCAAAGTLGWIARDAALAERALAASGADRLAAQAQALDARDAWRAEMNASRALHERWLDAFAAAGLPQEEPLQPLLESVVLVPDAMHLQALRIVRPYAATAEPATLRLDLAADLTGSGVDALRALVASVEASAWCAALRSTHGGLDLGDGVASAQEEVVLEATLR